MQITISGKDRKLLKLVEQLAEALGLSISKTPSKAETETKAEEENASGELYTLMKKMADAGGIKSIKDTVKWQREQRKNRVLYGREK